MSIDKLNNSQLTERLASDMQEGHEDLSFWEKNSDQINDRVLELSRFQSLAGSQLEMLQLINIGLDFLNHLILETNNRAQDSDSAEENEATMNYLGLYVDQKLCWTNLIDTTLVWNNLWNEDFLFDDRLKLVNSLLELSFKSGVFSIPGGNNTEIIDLILTIYNYTDIYQYSHSHPSIKKIMLWLVLTRETMIAFDSSRMLRLFEDLVKFNGDSTSVDIISGTSLSSDQYLLSGMEIGYLNQCLPHISEIGIAEDLPELLLPYLANISINYQFAPNGLQLADRRVESGIFYISKNLILLGEYKLAIKFMRSLLSNLIKFVTAGIGDSEVNSLIVKIEDFIIEKER